ncbi:nickel ABC transporter permease, partial [Dysosmobacter welbionis]
VADPLQGVADLGDLHELAVDDHLAGPGPLGLIVVSLAVHVAAGDIDVVGGGALVLADGDSGDHIAVIIVKGVDLGVGSNVGVGILIGLHVLEVLHHQVDVLHAGGDGLHIVHDLTILAARAASGILDLNVLQLHVQVDGVVVAVDVAAVVGGLQGHVLLIDGSAIAAHILGILGHIGVIVDDVLGGGHSHFLQGIHVVVVDRVGAPGVQLRQVLASGVDVALGHVHGDGIHVAVHEDDVGVSVPHRQVAVLAVDAGQEHVLVGILVLLNADHVAVGVQDHIVGDVLHIGVVILIQHFLIIHDGVSVVILGTTG